ncbi:hypothetical protein EYV96_06240 [Dyella terrae]|uniref:Energy transducer TonB n=2 Tax=Dyella terrae TaxID=522259 RepID=A0ABY1YW41_9GAMM|nr:hypothetical protein EYV96_06240 [Dyella terrae]
MLTLLHAALLSPLALAGSPAKPDLSAILTGSIVISEKGAVQSTALDVMPGRPVDESINGMIRQIVSGWRFAPATADGKPVPSQTSIHVRLVARPNDDGSFKVFAGGTTFGADPSMNATDYPQPLRLEAPSPPRGLDEVGGTVYLALRINREGRVDDAFVEQVNLLRGDNETYMSYWRDELARPVLGAARNWTFIPPSTGALASQATWTVHLGVNIGGRRAMKAMSDPSRSAWSPYFPGPIHAVPWLKGALINPAAPDALVQGAMVVEGTAPKLLTASHP